LKLSGKLKLSLLLITGFILLFAGCQDPPIGSLERAKYALNQAGKSGALRYSEKTYREAEELMKAGWMEMARQNGRFAPFRDYKAADSILNLAITTAQKATTDAQTQIQNLQALTKAEREELYNDLLEWREALNGALTKFRAEHYWNSGELAYKTSEKLMMNGEYEEAREVIAEGKESLKKMGAILADYDNDEATKIHIWRRWVKETLDDSKNSGGYAVIVDKSKHKTYLIQAGKVIHTYDCDLGYNSAHQKMFSGDGATPEGKYIVSEVKTNGRSKYYKALLINYPNATDKKRFQENKSRGIISGRARIGGLIEIHGEGGRGRDWTEGCIALTNKEMDHITKYIGIGTPITIVRRSNNWP
jgi:murein L,D-transpeptidase YafK